MESLEPFVPQGSYSLEAALKTGGFASHFLQYLLQPPQYVHLRQAVTQISSSACLVEFGGMSLPIRAFKGPLRLCIVHQVFWVPLCWAQKLFMRPGGALRVCRVV